MEQAGVEPQHAGAHGRRQVPALSGRTGWLPRTVDLRDHAEQATERGTNTFPAAPSRTSLWPEVVQENVVGVISTSSWICARLTAHAPPAAA